MVLEEYFATYAARDWERESISNPVRLAVVGLGGFARNRALPAIRSGSNCETTVLVTGSPADATEPATEFDVEHVLEYEAFLDGAAADVYDAVYVATPNALHGTYAVAAAERGKHVICEKPLETTVERATAIVDACADAEVTLMTAYRLQCEPAVRRMREMVRDGVVGDVVQVHGDFSHRLLDTAGPGSWRLDPDLAGGGALVDLGVYPLNTARFALDADPVSVYASTLSGDPPFGAVDEHVAFQLEFPAGATASCTASFDAHPNSQLRLVGTGGSIEIDSPFGGIVPHHLVVETEDVCTEYTGPPIDEVREEFDYFGYCVRTGTTPEPDGHDGLADLRVVEAAYESARTGRRIALE